MRNQPDSLRKLVDALKQLPAVGEKTAERLAFHLIHAENSYVERLILALREVKSRVKLCQRCFDITEEPLCAVCRNPKRDARQICVVEKPTDLRAIEATGQYQGVYHVLHGTVSPLDGDGPENLRIKELLQRVQEGGEVILATNHNVEGDATTHYLIDVLKREAPASLKVTRLASGMPIGGALAYADHATLANALNGRGQMR